ncbi:hypothetical protein SKAU_G00066490 [Synaphobranchus kaupii]|uniref:Uncharacterized protein n=1 Tax=Synaphobranchus kaupii TaxID=118154 RepID=A0A9Q1G5V8_SYNKA|nr:hypothetical protein SKAU_G00066490 [Synaphobranchus kaupii]
MDLIGKLTQTKRGHQRRLKSRSSKPGFKVEDRVWRQNIRSQQRKGGKLDANFLGPYTIKALQGKSADLEGENGQESAPHNSTSGSNTSSPNTSGPDTSGPDTSGPNISGPDSSGPNISSPNICHCGPLEGPPHSSTSGPNTCHCGPQKGVPYDSNSDCKISSTNIGSLSLQPIPG